jgi:hypothetical protein
VEARDRSYLLWLDKKDPPLDTPVSLAYGMHYPDFIDRVKSDRYHFACTNYTMRRPTKLFVLEVLVWPGAFASGPSVHFNMDVQRNPDPIKGPPADGREQLEQSSQFVYMGKGFARKGSSRADGYVPMFRRSMELLGWNPEGFDRYRLEIEYPLQFVGMQSWFELVAEA